VREAAELYRKNSESLFTEDNLGVNGSSRIASDDMLSQIPGNDMGLNIS